MEFMIEQFAYAYIEEICKETHNLERMKFIKKRLAALMLHGREFELCGIVFKKVGDEIEVGRDDYPCVLSA